MNKTDFHRKRNGVVAECRICKKQLQGSTQITSNFIRHLRLKHVEAFKEYKETKLETLQANGSKQDVFNKLTISYIADLMLPVSVVEKKTFKKLIECANPKLKLMSRPTATSLVNTTYSSMIDKLKMELSDCEFVCTTADVWSTKHRSFFGYTCHWLDDSLQRKSVALACKRFFGSHTFDRIHDAIIEIHTTYGLTLNKIVATVTDNGSNFVKAFKEFGVNTPLMFLDANGNNDVEDLEEMQLEDLSTNFGGNTLPRHIRCATHTLNLLATTDLLRILKTDTSYDKHNNVSYYNLLPSLYEHKIELCISKRIIELKIRL